MNEPMSIPSYIWIFCIILLILLVFIAFFDMNTLYQFSVTADKGEQAKNNLTRAVDTGIKLKEELNETLLRFQTELETIGSFFLPILRTPSEICQFCQIYGQEKINNFTPVDRAIITTFCQKADSIFACNSNVPN